MAIFSYKRSANFLYIRHIKYERSLLTSSTRLKPTASPFGLRKTNRRDTKGILYIYGADGHEMTRLDAAGFSRTEQSGNLKFDIIVVLFFDI